MWGLIWRTHRRAAGMRRPRALAAVLRSAALCAVVMALSGLTLAVPTASVPAAAEEADQLTLVSSQRLDPRTVELVFNTTNLGSETRVRIVYPNGYDAQTARRYPVLYLLHGCCDNYKSWTDKGDVKALTVNLPLIVVMPDGGQGGFYSDWYNFGNYGNPRWESYHIGQLIPWVDAHLRTVASRDGRAIAGLSMGGFGVMSYAARHPDMFIAAAAFSGAVDTNNATGGQFDAALNGLDWALPDSVWGPRATDEVRWRNHNPWDIAGNLKGLQLTIRTGDGTAGGPYNESGYDPVESGVHSQSVSFHGRLVSFGLPHVWDDYGPGNHGWPYWTRDLKQTLPDLMKTFANPPPAPVPFNYTTAEPSYSVYGWSVAIHRSALEFSDLQGVRPSGFKLIGSGSADVITAPWYRPSDTYRVNISGGTSNSASLRADAAGRLKITVPLGTANPFQQYTPQALLTNQTFTTSVTIEGPGANSSAAPSSAAALGSRTAAQGRLPATGTRNAPIILGILLLAAGVTLRPALSAGSRTRAQL